MAHNPIGVTGFDFIEFSGPNPEAIHRLFISLGFSRLKRHRSKKIDYYRQNDIHFLINQEPASFAVNFAALHGQAAAATGWRVRDAKQALEQAVARGARPARAVDYQRGEHPVEAIYGVGDSLIYFIDDHKDHERWAKLGFEDLAHPDVAESKGFALVDHLTNNVPQGQLQPLADFYKSVFGFEEIRYFDIRGQATGLVSYALRSPCGSFSIPINEGTEEKSQINEYLREYKGSGIQHIALLTADMLKTMVGVKDSGIETLDIDADYYDQVFARLPQITEDKERLKSYNLLIDGDDRGYLIQIFTKNVIGPIFFEFIQRKGHLGFGEGNFSALFRAIERDQIRRGVL